MIDRITLTYENETGEFIFDHGAKRLRRQSVDPIDASIL